MKKLVFSLVLAVFFATPVFSQMMDMQGKGHPVGYDQMMSMDHMGDMGGLCIEHADMMGLTEAQVMKMKPLHNEMQKRKARFTADLKIAEIEHMEIMDEKDFDMDKARSSVEKIADIKKAFHLEMLKTMKDMRSVLTSEQYKKMKKMMPMKPVGKKTIKTKMKH